MTLFTAQDKIIKGSLTEKDIDIKVAISVKTTVTGEFYQFEITDWHINVSERYNVPSFFGECGFNQQPFAILEAVWSHFPGSDPMYLFVYLFSMTIQLKH